MKQIRKITEDIYLVDTSIPQIGYSARHVTLGEEYELVKTFINQISQKRTRLDGCKILIFLEPQIDSGYPDIVIVKYKPLIHENSKIKSRLTSSHYKVLYEVDRKKKIGKVFLSRYLGINIQELCKLLRDLENANLVRLVNESVYRKAYRDYFCIKKIIAIEAKIDKWKDAMDQALLNTRFSNESYILMRKDKCRNCYEEKCREWGIGVFLLNGKMKLHVRPQKNPMPGSYIPFVFNDWITKIEMMKEN